MKDVIPIRLDYTAWQKKLEKFPNTLPELIIELKKNTDINENWVYQFGIPQIFENREVEELFNNPPFPEDEIDWCHIFLNRLHNITMSPDYQMDLDKFIDKLDNVNFIDDLNDKEKDELVSHIFFYLQYTVE